MATVKVRIPVVVDYEGHVVAGSAHTRTDQRGYRADVSRLLEYAAKFSRFGYALRTVIVELPIPEEVEVEGVAHKED